ncbi:AraC family transcriptional regulator [Paraburkholderia sp. SIMBA_055]
MGDVQVMLFRHAGRVDRLGVSWTVPDNRLVVADEKAAIVAEGHGDYPCFNFNAAELQSLYVDLLGLIRKQDSVRFFQDPVRQVAACHDVIDVSMSLAKVDRRLMLRFVYSYFLSVEPAYFSSLLHHFVDSTREFFDFVERNSLNPWPVSQYADELGISVRKLNTLFYEKCGVSAKRWVLEQRLQKARELLLSTSMKVTDVAQRCGFNSHAHFTESFTRRYNDCPRKLRQRSIPILGRNLEIAVAHA